MSSNHHTVKWNAQRLACLQAFDALYYYFLKFVVKLYCLEEIIKFTNCDIELRDLTMAHAVH